jgi:putative acetyltransferase
MRIELDDVSQAQVRGLLAEHLTSMALLSPPESVHALDIESLQAPEIKFWTVWTHDGELMGCGALKRLDAHHAEIKSMRTAAAHLRKGVARALLVHLLDTAKASGFTRLSLETGSADAFAPARSLYSSFGFEYCPPFADYIPDPHSVFMTREIR